MTEPGKDKGPLMPFQQARVPSACLECNQAIEILVDNSGIEIVIRAEENRRRYAESLCRQMAEAVGNIVNSHDREGGICSSHWDQLKKCLDACAAHFPQSEQKEK